MTSSSSPLLTPRRERLEALLALATLWALLWLGGYPKPNVDDGFFGGTGIHLAATGQLANPWIAGWFGWLPGVDPETYLIQPPLHPLVMAGWISLFGVSTASLTGFACTLGLAACYAVWRLFRELAGSMIAAWLAAAVIGSWLLFRGLRPEALATMFAAAGQFHLLRHRHLPGWFWGGLLSSASVISHPLWVIIVVPATALQLASPSFPRPLPRKLLLALGAGILAALVALIAGLGANFSRFLHDLAVHAQFVAPSDGRLQAFRTHFAVGYDYYIRLVVLVLSALATIALGFQAPGVARRAAAGLLGLLLLGFVLYAAQCTMYLVLAAAVLPLALPGVVSGWRRTLACSAAVILVAWHGLQHTLQALGDRQHDARPLRGAVASYLAQAKPGQVVFDATTLRTFFDYRPPAGAVDIAWAWSPGREPRWWSWQQLAPRDLWIINPTWSPRQTPADEMEKLRFVLAGRSFVSVRTTRGLLLVTGADLPPPVKLPFLRSAPP